MNIQSFLNTSTLVPVLIIVAVVIAAVLVGLSTGRRMRSMRLKKRFGPEYDYALDKLGDRRTAEADLKERENRVVKLNLHELNDHEKDIYHREWTDIQANFVDDPPKSVEQGNRLITEVMIARGFPVADFEQRTADLSVLYPNFVPKYRHANEIVDKNQNGSATTEDLRQAMLDFHSLFDQLLGTVHPSQSTEEQVKEVEAV